VGRQCGALSGRGCQDPGWLGGKGVQYEQDGRVLGSEGHQRHWVVECCVWKGDPEGGPSEITMV